MWGVHKALNLTPVEYSPVPRRFGGYGLPDEKPTEDNRIIVQGWNGSLGWDGIKALQDELYDRRRAGSLSDAN